MERDRFVLTNDMLHYIDPGPQHRLRITVPSSQKLRLMDELQFIVDLSVATLQREGSPGC